MHNNNPGVALMQNNIFFIEYMYLETLKNVKMLIFRNSNFISVYFITDRGRISFPGNQFEYKWIALYPVLLQSSCNVFSCCTSATVDVLLLNDTNIICYGNHLGYQYTQGDTKKRRWIRQKKNRMEKHEPSLIFKRHEHHLEWTSFYRQIT